MIRGLPPDWKRPLGRPSHTWHRAVEADGQQNIGLVSAWRKAALYYLLWMIVQYVFVTTGGALWTQQRSSGVCYKRRKENVNNLAKQNSKTGPQPIRLCSSRMALYKFDYYYYYYYYSHSDSDLWRDSGIYQCARSGVVDSRHTRNRQHWLVRLLGMNDR